MLDDMLQLIRARTPIEELDPGPYRTLKVQGMQFNISAYNLPELGHLSLLSAKGFLGMMQMDTLILNPLERDLPLFSYDRIHAMGADTLILEYYNTFLSPMDLSPLDAVQQKYKALPERDPGTHWYDGLRLPQSLSKKGKKADTTAMDNAVKDSLTAFLDLADTAAPCAASEKRGMASIYVEGLLSRGGPSTDVFRKHLGRDQTGELFRSVLFGTTPMLQNP